MEEIKQEDYFTEETTLYEDIFQAVIEDDDVPEEYEDISDSVSYGHEGYKTRMRRRAKKLNNEKALALAEKIITGSEKERNAAFETLFDMIDPLLERFITRYFFLNGLDPDDMIQEAHIAIMRSIAGFDKTKGVKLISYLSPVIFRAWSLFFSRAGIITVKNKRLYDYYIKVGREKKEIYMAEGRKATNEELMQMPLFDKYRSIKNGERFMTDLFRKIDEFRNKYTAIRLEDVLSEASASNTKVEAVVIDERSEEQYDLVERHDIWQQLHDAMKRKLTTREYFIICAMYGLINEREYTAKETGEMLNGLSATRVNQLKTAALQKLSEEESALWDMD